MTVGTVLEIFITGAAGEPMIDRSEAEAVPGSGLAGDRYALGAGFYSDKPTTAGARELTLIDERAIAQVLGADWAAVRLDRVSPQSHHKGSRSRCPDREGVFDWRCGLRGGARLPALRASGRADEQKGHEGIGAHRRPAGANRARRNDPGWRRNRSARPGEREIGEEPQITPFLRATIYSGNRLPK